MLEKSREHFIDAIRTGDIEGLQQILEKDPLLLQGQVNGKSVIHFAAEAGQNGTIEFLQSKGLDINAKTIHGSTAIHFAAEAWQDGTIEFLQSKGINDQGIRAAEPAPALFTQASIQPSAQGQRTTDTTSLILPIPYASMRPSTLPVYYMQEIHALRSQVARLETFNTQQSTRFIQLEDQLAQQNALLTSINTQLTQQIRQLVAEKAALKQQNVALKSYMHNLAYVQAGYTTMALSIREEQSQMPYAFVNNSSSSNISTPCPNWKKALNYESTDSLESLSRQAVIIKEGQDMAMGQEEPQERKRKYTQPSENENEQGELNTQRNKKLHAGIIRQNLRSEVSNTKTTSSAFIEGQAVRR